mmetsp:Transcript_150214/g.262455  ORF Transcript_150214/g.262455 Transcript_150214/m.262455 type:complete len:107 (-) Transcript_150214:202-522(-)
MATQGRATYKRDLLDMKPRHFDPRGPNTLLSVSTPSDATTGQHRWRQAPPVQRWTPSPAKRKRKYHPPSLRNLGKRKYCQATCHSPQPSATILDTRASPGPGDAPQ